MDISKMLFNQFQFSADRSNLNSTNSVLDISKKSSSFDSHYQSYKNKYEQKSEALTDNNSVQKQTKKNPIPAKSSVKENSVKRTNSTDSDSSKENVSSKDEIAEKFVQELADKLNVSVDKIKEILEKLNLDIFDLMDSSNLTQFMTELMDIKNPIEFLTSEEVQQTFKSASEVIQKYQQLFENAEVNENTQLINTDIQPEKSNATEDIAENLNSAVKTDSSSKLSADENLGLDVAEDSDTKNMPTVEIKNSTRNGESGGKKSDDNQNQNQNFNSTFASQTTDTNYINAYSNVNYQQQQIVNDIVSNVSNLTNAKDTNQIISQIVDKIKVEIKPDVSEMKLLLKPDTLGELSLKITTQNNIVTAQFVAESQQVKEVLQANFNHLKDTLQQLGLIIDEISVSVGQQNSEQRQHFEQNQQKSKRRMSQIIESMDTIDELEASEGHKNPYELSDNQVDYMA